MILRDVSKVFFPLHCAESSTCALMKALLCVMVMLTYHTLITPNAFAESVPSCSLLVHVHELLEFAARSCDHEIVVVCESRIAVALKAERGSLSSVPMSTPTNLLLGYAAGTTAALCLPAFLLGPLSWFPGSPGASWLTDLRVLLWVLLRT